MEELRQTRRGGLRLLNGGRFAGEQSEPARFDIRQCDDVDGALRATLIGEIDIAVADEVLDRLRQLRRFDGTVRLDLSELRFIDFRGMDAVMAAVTDARRDGREVEVDRCISPIVERVVAFAGVAPDLWP